MLENRGVMKRTFPELFANFAIEPVDAYPSQLYDTLCALAPHRAQPEVVVLTPGVFNLPALNIAIWRSRWAANWWRGVI